MWNTSSLQVAAVVVVPVAVVVVQEATVAQLPVNRPAVARRQNPLYQSLLSRTQSPLVQAAQALRQTRQLAQTGQIQSLEASRQLVAAAAAAMSGAAPSTVPPEAQAEAKVSQVAPGLEPQIKVSLVAAAPPLIRAVAVVVPPRLVTPMA